LFSTDLLDLILPHLLVSYFKIFLFLFSSLSDPTGIFHKVEPKKKKGSPFDCVTESFGRWKYVTRRWARVMQRHLDSDERSD
jgi:hypothetical protein